MLPMDDRDGWIWLDGALQPWRRATLHVLSHGLHYAGAVFEGERAYEGTVFRLQDHGRRLLRSAEILDLPCRFTAAELDRATEEVLAANRIRDAYVRRLIWRGPEQIGVAARAGRGHVAVAAWPWARYFETSGETSGLRLSRARWRRPDPKTAPTEAKASCLYAISTLAKHDAERAGFDDALMLDWRGHVAEATGANVLFVRKGVIHTPPPDGILNGITRQTVLTLASACGIEVVERTILPAELDSFDEAILTGTAVEVAPVGVIDGLRYTLGPVGKRLRRAYAETVHACPAISPAA